MKYPLVDRLAGPHPQWLFEENYQRLRCLLPEPRSGVNYVLGHGPQALRVTVKEIGPYTSELVISANQAGETGLTPPLHLKLRIYHDARLVEVVAYQNCANIPPPYAARQAMGMQRDERLQANRLLYELLQYCRQRGYVRARIESMA